MMLQMALFHSFYGWTVFHCIYTYDIFIHSSVNGYLGCFHIVVIVNTAAMNIGCMYLFEVVFSGYMPRNGIARSFKGASPLNFLDITLVGGGGACNNNRCSPFVYISVTRSSNLWPNYRLLIFGEEGTVCLLCLLKLNESCTKVAKEDGCNFTSEPFPGSTSLQ